MLLVEVADAFLECLLAYFETLVYLFGITLVTKVAVAVVLIEVLQKRVGKLLCALLARRL